MTTFKRSFLLII